MTRIKRLRPDPIPVIHPMPEYLATGERAKWYKETKLVLQVPWMGVVTMAYAHYPTFFGELWRGLKPLCESRAYVEAFQDLRQYVEARTAELGPKSLIGPLTEMGYTQREIDAIREMNTVVDELPTTVTGKAQKFVMRQKMIDELGLSESQTA